ncbi:SET domain-containing protein, partial [Dentipellis sp. KUC8613]
MASSSHSVDPIDLLSDPVEPSTPDSEPATHVSSLSRAQNFSTHNFEDLIIDGIPIIALTPARLMAEFPPQVYYAKDLPHLLQDHMNALAPAFRRTEMARTVFEAVIRDNTSADEPDAPPIRVVNDFDDEPTPPWEFHYSNHMWHARGVPPPDLQNLRGCGCEGVCDPRSKTCSCMIRQQKYLEETAIQGCIYDDRGRLKVHDYPIFECNDLCGCLDECKNRVVQHGRKCEIDIRKTEKKGWGVFARKKIPAGTFVGIYAGELILDEDGDERGQKYNKFGRTYLFTLDFYYLKDTVEDRDEWEPKYVVDAYHAGNNHSCDPNCTINPCYINEANIDKPLLTIFAYRDIEASEELCFSYHGPPDE